MSRWVMLADLERCVGCQTCTAACRHANATSPAVQWRKVLDIETGTYPNVSRTFVPVGCQHCADPPCMHVCPSTATRRRDDGLVTIDYDICIGCAYCDVACPYQARFKIDAPHFAYGGTAMKNEIEREDPRRIGVAQKCTFCSDRIDFGLGNGLTPGVDEAATPVCVNSCIADALHFGDTDDPNSNVSRLLREQRHFRMHEELETQPGFYYLYGRADPTDARATDSALPSHHEPTVLRSKGVAPWHQQHWDWKAAGNFICGGAGSGLFVFAAVAQLFGGTAFAIGWTALALVALGLFLVLLKIGRPWRFLFVLRQPQRSWMAREAWIATVLFPAAAAAIWLNSSIGMVAAAVPALSYLFSQAMIFREAKGIPAWRTPRIVPLIVATGLAEGAGIYLAAAAVMASVGDSSEADGMIALAMIALVLAALRASTWTSYFGGLRRMGAPASAIAVLKAFQPWFLVLGLALPAAMIIIGLIVSYCFIFPAAGICIAGAGAAFKFVLVTRAGYNQGFALAHIPTRGAEHHGLSFTGVKPGWQ
jgi:Fe-S-cluster-containing dehydrogenase component